MDLSIYLSSLPRGGKSKFAHSIEVSKSFLRQMETGYCPVPPAVAKRIELQTKGKVKKSELRPDLWGK